MGEHQYRITPTPNPGGLNLKGYTVECSCGHEELVPWLSHIRQTTHGPVMDGETPKECRERAARIALYHIGSDLELSTQAEYRTRRFVRSTEGMAEMFPEA